ncbi:MAG: hypothetical protein GY772_04945, partial [bacterium]|nr:hypothetical protein [bacterium]
MRPFVEGIRRRLMLSLDREDLIGGLREALQEQDAVQRVRMVELVFAGQGAERIVYDVEVRAAQRAQDVAPLAQTAAVRRVAAEREAAAARGVGGRASRAG